ncbi:MAG TPA: lytic transglycosylase domain-containing protein, partial [Rhizomicrobium sp.]|nr:lytic transglycosylase domain-containing protein [Rhizomicrobium sp.]
RLHGASLFSAKIHATGATAGTGKSFGTKCEAAGARLVLHGAAKLTFMTGIAGAILFAWQGIALHVQQFSVRTDPMAPVAAVAKWIHTTWNAVVPQLPEIPESTFAAENRMSASQLVNRWTPLIASASQRFSVPANWIRAVVQMESGGRTMLNEDTPITSRTGAMGLMQLEPGTYQEMRTQYRLGPNAYNPGDNIAAGAAYLRWLYSKYGYPAMFAAYNDGPGHLEERLMKGKLLPDETRNYISRIVTALGSAGAAVVGSASAAQAELVKFTRPNGTPVWIDVAGATLARASLPGEYAPGVKSVITVGRLKQGVVEDLASVQAAIRAHGGIVEPRATRLAGAHGVHTLRMAVTGKSRVAHRYAALAHRGRVHVTFREAAANSGAIHLKPIAHGGRAKG